MRLVVIAMLIAAAARAEYLRIEQPFGGMECASCTEFVLKRLTARAGVESAVVDQKGAFVVTLKPGNTVRLRNVVDLVQQSGFKPGETSVVARGTLHWGEAGTLPKLKVLASDPPLAISADPDKKLPARLDGQLVELHGTVVREGAAETLRVKTVAVTRKIVVD